MKKVFVLRDRRSNYFQRHHFCCPPWSRTTIHAIKERCPAFRRGGTMSGRQDSNLQPQAPKACILPIEILPEVFVETVVPITIRRTYIIGFSVRCIDHLCYISIRRPSSPDRYGFEPIKLFSN